MALPQSRALTNWLSIAISLVVGIVFVISGFAKGVDPYGTIYKIGEYLAAWDIPLPESLLLIASIGLASWEFVLGGLLALGCFRKGAPWGLLLLMVFMLPLSAYIAMANPVSDCGCFGDLWVISNTATFWKNVVLTILLVFLVLYRRRAPWFIKPGLQWVVAFLLFIYLLIIALYGYNVQPLSDFRRFPTGQELIANADEDNPPEYEFIYQSPQGEIKSFGENNLPDDDWTFVERKLKSGTEVTSDGFPLLDSDGEDIAADLITTQGSQVIISIPDLKNMNLGYAYTLRKLGKLLESKNVPMTILVGGGEAETNQMADIVSADFPIASVEPSQIKELVRGNPGFVYLDNDTIQFKSTLAAITSPWDWQQSVAHHYLQWLTWALILALAWLIILSNITFPKHGRRNKKHKAAIFHVAKRGNS